MAKAPHNILIYEDLLARSRKFLPLTYTRCVAELRSGAFTPIERVRSQWREARIFLHVRPELKDAVAHRYDVSVNEAPVGRTLLINAREALIIASSNDWPEVDLMPSDMAENLISGEAIESPLPVDEDTPQSLWDILRLNAVVIQDDAELWSRSRVKVERPSFPNCAIINPEKLFVHPGAKVDSSVVLDCSKGPIIIDEGSRIMPQTAIIGPVYIGKNSLVKIGAKIYGGTTIGPVSKIGGEVENSIVQGYSNKQHDGYLGHSFIGEWVNLGAGTNTSDLKNNYSSVRVTIEGEEFDTGSLLVGLLMGDHSKTSIGMQFNTGTIVGVSCNIFDAGFPPKWIPNFSWGGAAGITSYRYEKAIEVARAVMARRGVAMNAEEESVLRNLFNERNRISV